MKETFTELSECLSGFTAHSTTGCPDCGKVEAGQHISGVWMMDGNFYFPMSQPDGTVAICVGLAENFKLI